MRNVFSLPRFAKFMGYKSVRNKEFHRLLNGLISLKVVEVQQGGFSADSLHHNKLVVVRNQEKLEEMKIHQPQETVEILLEPTRKTKTRHRQRVRVITKVIVRNTHWVTKRIGVTLLTRASGGKGPNSGIYLYVPKDHVEAYGIKPGQKIEAKILRVFKG